MKPHVDIRRYQASDLPGVEALEARVQPYRPEDQDEVQAMFGRAAEAKRQSDRSWMASPADDPPGTPDGYAAFWVAVQSTGEEAEAVIGTVAVRTFRVGEELALTHPLAQIWGGRDDVAELRRVRVAPEARGQGIGTRLCQSAIAWAQTHGYKLLVVNTTTPQTPALRLYGRLGFKPVGKSFIDRYELVWSVLIL